MGISYGVMDWAIKKRAIYVEEDDHYSNYEELFAKYDSNKDLFFPGMCIVMQDKIKRYTGGPGGYKDQSKWQDIDVALTGPKGEKGDKGEPGSPGRDGSMINNVELVGDDLTISLNTGEEVKINDFKKEFSKDIQAFNWNEMEV